MIYAVMALFALIFGFTLLMIYHILELHSVERKELYDRLQAGTLKEYKLLAEPPEPVEKEPKERHDFI